MPAEDRRLSDRASRSPAEHQLGNDADQGHNHYELDQEPHDSGNEAEHCEGHKERYEPSTDD